MSKINDLIKQYCHDGVEWKELGNICKITTGKLNANAMNENGKYLFFTCDEKPFKIDTYSFDTEAILISGNGSKVGHINYYKGKFDAYQRTYVLSNFIEEFSIKFILFYLKHFLQNYIKKYFKNGSVPYITLPMLKSFQIPLPPLPIQQEIVNILDKFTELEAELEAELEGRKKQYEHYRNTLLTFGDDVEWKELGEVCDIYTGGEPPIDFTKDMDINGNYIYPIYGNGRDIYGYSKTYKVDRDAVCISSIGANTGTVFYYTKNFTPIIRLKVLIPNNFNLITKYLYYVATAINFVSKNSGGIPNMNASDVKRHKIPVPPLPVQEKIVAILDKFDKLVNNIKEGLPAEIALRRKQYEFYRNKLLDFKEMEK